MIADHLTEELISQYIWSVRNVRTEKGGKLDFINYPFLKEIYINAFKPVIVVKKATQIGLSTWAICHSLWLLEHFPLTIIYTLPTGGDCSAFSATRFNPIINNSVVKGEKLIDSVGIKQIGQGFIYFKGTWNEREAISVPSDCNFHDEIDYSKMDVIETYEERLTNSFMKWRRYFSTPTLKNYGIADLYETTDQREWFVPCSVCGHFQPITEENIIDAEFRCLKCKGVLDRAKGKFVPQAESKIIGYHIPQAGGLIHSAQEILDKKKRYKIRRLYYNAVWGMEYEEVAEALTDMDIANALTKIIPDAEGNFTVIGVDWGDESWAVVLRGKYDRASETMMATVIYMEKIDNPDTTTHHARVLELMDKFKAECCADFGYGDTKNKNIAKKKPYRFWQCEYKAGMLEANSKVTKYGELEVKHIQIDRTISLEETIAEVKNSSGDDSGIRIVNSDMIDDFRKHAKGVAPDRETGKFGKERVVFVKKGEDHLIHALNYARILLKLMSSSEPSVTFFTRRQK